MVTTLLFSSAPERQSGKDSPSLWLGTRVRAPDRTCTTKSGNEVQSGIRESFYPVPDQFKEGSTLAMKSNNRERASVETVIGEGSTLEGTIVVAHGIRIDGSLSGRLEVGGNVRIGRTGQVVADIVCEKDVVVAGRVEGKLTVYYKQMTLPTNRKV